MRRRKWKKNKAGINVARLRQDSVGDAETFTASLLFNSLLLFRRIESCRIALVLLKELKTIQCVFASQ